MINMATGLHEDEILPRYDFERIIYLFTLNINRVKLNMKLFCYYTTSR